MNPESSAGGQWRDHTRSIDPDHEPAENLKGSAVLAGFSCDEGVRRNNGRPGAKDGPEVIRNALARLAWHHAGEMLDAGDVDCSEEDLETAQEAFGHLISKLLKAGSFPIGIGGGHEIAFGHYLGIREFIPDAKLGIINFDAHFDMRIPDNGRGNSGTSFYQIATHAADHGLPFHYLCIGIQKENNSRQLFETARTYEANWIEASEVHITELKILKNRLEHFLETVDHVYVSYCLDVFNASFAPGVSAVNPLGLNPDVVLPLTRHLLRSGKVISLDIAELNPHFDIDQRTARLAAALIYHSLCEMDWRL